MNFIFDSFTNNFASFLCKYSFNLIYFSISLMRFKTDKAAKNLILSSIAYISLLQVVFVIDRYL